ncbi:MAG: UDP-N-acetylmuramoyl-L-alanyl-D-glutamate--2,6-diaminopimelate ligase [Bdellovibrionaceae bacterium]|nr:UDP-N-acetylmuramoyl-L-alanyl-D-glutamate--2,6-diaminopimelate ligase [Pseudobdellovibrionaceae bacterium]
MKLQDLMRGLPFIQIHCETNPEVIDLQFDSRSVRLGSLFVAIVGVKADGHHFLVSAIRQGAIAVVVQKGSDFQNALSDDCGKKANIPVIVVENSREALDFLACQFYGNPSKNLLCVGVTGTNGKTSLTYLIEYLLNAAQCPTGVIGTIDHHLRIPANVEPLADRVGPEGAQDLMTWPADGTTPNPILLQARLREFWNLGAKAAVLEVTSHALDQKRADGVSFDVGVFTNLTQDHLDYHDSMENYFSTKVRFFTEILSGSQKTNKMAIINVTDPWGQKLRELIRTCDFKQLTFGRETGDFKYRIENMTATETKFKLQTPQGQADVQSPLSGEHNVQNVVAALAAVSAAGFDLRKAVHAMVKFPGIPGRLQLVPNSKGRPVFVDYAHTPDGLESVLKTLRHVQSQGGHSGTKIWTVFGCGGDRDSGKRPLMAEIAERLSDQVIVTSDNPRMEDPEKIIDQIVAGFSKVAHFNREVDRKKAIEMALKFSGPNDLILIAGKGHEETQQLGNQKIHFSDVEVAESFLKGEQ